MEGQWSRRETPLRELSRRERFVAIGIAAIVVVATVALLIGSAGNGNEPLGPGCLRAMVPGLVGGFEVNPCGTQARYMCANHAGRHDPGSLSIQEACREAGIPMSPLSGQAHSGGPS
jgi:hypothetical protein